LVRAVPNVVSAFAVVAVALAAAGIFGVVMFTVQQRRREFGLRLALGGSPRDIFFLVLRFGLRLTAAGLAIGTVASTLLVRFVSSLLFGVEAFDPIAFVAALALVVTIGMLSCLAPARRAVRANPAETLRVE
jgi:ABC-type antimicrobial peptide transport system permease subunit